MADRTYRWLLITLAVVGLTADQVRSTGCSAGCTTTAARRRPPKHAARQLLRVVHPGWFKLIAQFDPDCPAVQLRVLRASDVGAPR